MSKKHPADEMLAEEPETSGAVDAAEALGRDIAALEGGLADHREQYLRLAADFENFKRRKSQELADRSRYAAEEAALGLLPVLDNLQRSLAHLPDSDDAAVTNFTDGIAMVVRDFEAALERVGVTPIPALGEAFDPALHEAIAAEESADVSHDTVIDELQRGYRLHDRVLRPAVVRIAHPAR